MLDPSIILAGKTPQFDVGEIMGTALQLKKMQQQVQTDNALKAIFSEPGAIDEKTGHPTVNALAKATRLSPQVGLKLTGEVATAQEREAQSEHTQSETQTAQAKAYRDHLSEALGEYDADVKSGGVDPLEAERKMKGRIRDQLFSDSSIDAARRDKNWAMIEGMKPAQLRALTLTADQKSARDEEERKETQERTPATMGGKPVLVDKQGNVYDPNDGKKLQVTSPVEKEATTLDPQRAEMEKRRLALQEKVAAGSGDLTPQEIEFGAEMVLNGQPMPNMGYGAAGSKARQKILAKAAEMAASHSGSAAAGADDMAARKDVLAADKSSLTAATKQEQSVRQFSQTAMGLADKVEGLMDKVAAQGPEFWAKFIQNVKTKALADEDTREFLGYMTDLQSENAKIMAGSTGSVAQVSAHNQDMMSHMLTGDLPLSEIRGGLKSVREGIKMRNASVNDELERQRAQIKADTAGGGSAAASAAKGELAHPASRADYDALPSGAHYSKSGDKPGTYRVKP
jgi:hypothetical protein